MSSSFHPPNTQQSMKKTVFQPPSVLTSAWWWGWRSAWQQPGIWPSPPGTRCSRDSPVWGGRRGPGCSNTPADRRPELQTPSTVSEGWPSEEKHTQLPFGKKSGTNFLFQPKVTKALMKRINKLFTERQKECEIRAFERWQKEQQTHFLQSISRCRRSSAAPVLLRPAAPLLLYLTRSEGHPTTPPPPPGPTVPASLTGTSKIIVTDSLVAHKGGIGVNIIVVIIPYYKTIFVHFAFAWFDTRTVQQVKRFCLLRPGVPQHWSSHQ